MIANFFLFRSGLFSVLHTSVPWSLSPMACGPVGLWDSSIDVCVWEEDFASRIITQYDGTNVLRQQINELLVACFVVVCWWWRGWCGVFSVRTCLVNVIGVVNDHILTDFSSLKTISIILYYFQFIGGISMFRIS